MFVYRLKSTFSVNNFLTICQPFIGFSDRYIEMQYTHWASLLWIAILLIPVLKSISLVNSLLPIELAITIPKKRAGYVWVRFK